MERAPFLRFSRRHLSIMLPLGRRHALTLWRLPSGWWMLLLWWATRVTWPDRHTSWDWRARSLWVRRPRRRAAAKGAGRQ